MCFWYFLVLRNPLSVHFKVKGVEAAVAGLSGAKTQEVARLRSEVHESILRILRKASGLDVRGG